MAGFRPVFEHMFDQAGRTMTLSAKASANGMSEVE